MFKPLISGLIGGQNEYMPGFALGQQGLQIQLQLAQAADVCDTTTGKSTEYVLKGLRCNCNTITVASELQSSSSTPKFGRNQGYHLSGRLWNPGWALFVSVVATSRHQNRSNVCARHS